MNLLPESSFSHLTRTWTVILLSFISLGLQAQEKFFVMDEYQNRQSRGFCVESTDNHYYTIGMSSDSLNNIGPFFRQYDLNLNKKATYFTHKDNFSSDVQIDFLSKFINDSLFFFNTYPLGFDDHILSLSDDLKSIDTILTFPPRYVPGEYYENVSGVDIRSSNDIVYLVRVNYEDTDTNYFRMRRYINGELYLIEEDTMERNVWAYKIDNDTLYTFGFELFYGTVDANGLWKTTFDVTVYDEKFNRIYHQIIDLPKEINLQHHRLIRDKAGNFYFGQIKAIEVDENSVPGMPFIYKLDRNYNFEWLHELHEDNFYSEYPGSNGVDLAIAHDGLNIIAASEFTVEDEYTSFKVYPSVTKISPEGETIWHKRYSFFDCPRINYQIEDITATTDQGWIIIGDINYQMALDQPFELVSYMFKIDDDGNVSDFPTSIVELPDLSLDLSLSPNPSQDFLTVHLPDGFKSSNEENFDIIDSQGKRHLRGVLGVDRSVDVSTLDTGSYFLRFFDGQVFLGSEIFVKQ